MFLPARTQAARNAAACSLRKPSPTSSSSVPAARRKRRIVQIVVPVRGDGRDRGGQAGAVGKARLDARGDPVEPLALDLLEQALDEGAHLAVVVEDEVGDALDPLAGVAEEALGAVDHPLLRERVGEHPLGDRAEPDQLVAELGSDPGALPRVERRRLPAQRLRLVGAQGLLDQLLGTAAPVLACEVHLLLERAHARGELEWSPQLRASPPPSRQRDLLGLLGVARAGWHEPELSLSREQARRVGRGHREAGQARGHRRHVGAPRRAADPCAAHGRARDGPRGARRRARNGARRAASAGASSSCVLAVAPGAPAPLSAIRSRSGGIPRASSESSWSSPARSCSSRAPMTRSTASAVTTASRWTRHAEPASSPSKSRKPTSAITSGNCEARARSVRATTPGRASSLQRLRGFRCADEDRRPARSSRQPAIEQLAERAVSSGGRPRESENRALSGIGSEPQVECSAERIELDEHARPSPGGEAGERRGTLARSGGALGSDHREHGAAVVVRGVPACSPLRVLPFDARLLRGPAQSADEFGGRVGRLDGRVDAEGEELLPLA